MDACTSTYTLTGALVFLYGETVMPEWVESGALLSLRVLESLILNELSECCQWE